MFTRFPIRSSIALVAFLGGWFGLFQVISLWIQNPIYTHFLAFAVTLNVGLILLLLNIRVFQSLPTPVPEAVSSAEESQAPLQANIPDTPVKESLEQDATVSCESEFTLGVTSAEPSTLQPDVGKQAERHVQPEFESNSMQRSKIPVSQEAFFNKLSASHDEVEVKEKSKASVESAFLRAHQMNSRKRAALNQLERFRHVCLTLKQANLHVSVWTDEQLRQLLDEQLSSTAADTEMVAALLPQNIVSLSLLGREPHAQLFKNMLNATGKGLDIRFVTSVVTSDARCTVSFEYQGKKVSWRFSEIAGSISEKFLSKATHWIGNHAGGQFLPYGVKGETKTLVFVPNLIIEKLAMELKKPQEHSVAKSNSIVI